MVRVRRVTSDVGAGAVGVVRVCPGFDAEGRRELRLVFARVRVGDSPAVVVNAIVVLVLGNQYPVGVDRDVVILYGIAERPIGGSAGVVGVTNFGGVLGLF